MPDQHREMVLIPAVEYIFPAWGMEAPFKRSSEPFYIDRYEVSCVRYQAFLDATGHPSPESGYWPDGRFPESAENLPVFQVSWEDAAAFAKWEGKRLPTVLEWELAAGGKDGRKFPWGNEGDIYHLNTFANADPQLVRGKAFHEYLAPIDSYPNGVSPFGVFNMVGNVMEWTATEAGMGGHFLKNSIRDKTPYGCAGDDFYFSYVGFRCVMSVEDGEMEDR
ncbi:MAG: SUMF1/EgtB/PvdO family nonheme iron enzyme [Planctomycetota bacterium]